MSSIISLDTTRPIRYPPTREPQRVRILHPLPLNGRLGLRLITSMERLLKEIAVLLRCQEKYKYPALRIVRQLIVDWSRPNGPEPPCPEWVKFKWPKSGHVGEMF